jgi:hypothetical protein
MTKVKLTLPLRNTAHAKRVMAEHYPFKCCVICGIDLEYGIDIAHLDQNSANNDPDNLAWLCRTHHALRHPLIQENANEINAIAFLLSR